MHSYAPKRTFFICFWKICLTCHIRPPEWSHCSVGWWSGDDWTEIFLKKADNRSLSFCKRNLCALAYTTPTGADNWQPLLWDFILHLQRASRLSPGKSQGFLGHPGHVLECGWDYVRDVCVSPCRHPMSICLESPSSQPHAVMLPQPFVVPDICAQLLSGWRFLDHSLCVSFPVTARLLVSRATVVVGYGGCQGYQGVTRMGRWHT